MFIANDRSIFYQLLNIGIAQLFFNIAILENLEMKHSFKFFIAIIFILIPYSNLFSQLSGNYTIGIGGDYTSINSAVSELVANGVKEPVIFDIITGHYDESVTIDSIKGASIVNTVTIQSQTGNSNDVTWIYSPDTPMHVLKINGADFLIIRNIQFPDNNGIQSAVYRILFQGYCDNIKILNNVFKGGVKGFNDGSIFLDRGLASFDASMTDLLVEGNLFRNANGIVFNNTLFRSTGTKIINNDFFGFFSVSIFKHDDLLIEKNSMTIPTGNTKFPPNCCIEVGDCNGNLRIFKNKIIAGYPNSYGLVHGILVRSYTGPGAFIVNNFISTKSGVGIWINDSYNINIFYNTIRSISPASDAINFAYSSLTNVKNNIFQISFLTFTI